MTPALKLNLFVGFPSYGGNGGIASEHPDIREWWAGMVLKLQKERERGRIGEVITRTLNDTPVTLVRNQFVKLAKHHDCHLLMMIDSDQSPEKHKGEAWFKPFWDEAFEFIYERYHKGPHCVFAPYCGAPDGKENCFVFNWHNYGNHGEQTEFSLEQYLREQAELMSGIHEAAAGPTGLILYDMRCFDLIEPYRGSKREIFEKVKSGELSIEEAERCSTEGYFYYEYKDCHADEKASTEDVTNTRDISLAGCVKLGYNPVHCAWDSWIGHHKPWNVGKPQRFLAAQVGNALRKAVLDNRQPNQRIVETSMLNRGEDPLARKLQAMAHSSLEAYKANGKQNGKPRPELVTAEVVPFHYPSEKLHPQWKPWDKAERFVETLSAHCAGEGVILDIGPGNRPFSKATEFVGRRHADWNDKRPFVEIDLNCDRLPYDDQEVAFVYCRHTLEDVDNPEHLLSEIKRVARAGWIECPSPIAETSRGVSEGHNGKGYAHHRSVVWTDGSTLKVLPKLPKIEELAIAERKDLLNEGAWYWNSYHVWTEKPLDYKMLKNELDFNINSDHRYEFLLREACRASIAAAREIYQLSTGTLPGELSFFPWYDGLETPTEHLDLLAALVKGKAEHLPKVVRPRVLEVGSFLGKTAIAMADAGATVHCVDHWRGSPSDPSHLHVIAAGGSDDVYDEYLKRVGDRKDRTIVPWRRSSLEAAAMEWQAFDIIFIDAEHTYSRAKEDILAWWKHLRDDGVMAIHDYMTIQFPGVTEAVKELFGDVEPCATCGHGSIAVVRKADHLDLLEKHADREAVS